MFEHLQVKLAAFIGAGIFFSLAGGKSRDQVVEKLNGDGDQRRSSQ